MKRFAFFVLTIAFIVLYSSICQASLIQQTNNGDQVVYDNVNDQYWISDLSLFAGQNLNNQLSGISGLNGFSGITNWHMATLSEITPLWNYSFSEITTTFLPSREFSEDWKWYSGRYGEAASQNSHYVGVIMYNYGSEDKSPLSTISLDDNYGNFYQGAWITGKKVSTNNVPEPATMTLIGSMLAGLIGYKKIKS